MSSKPMTPARKAPQRTYEEAMYLAGREACQRGHARADCPYLGSGADAWEQGWDAMDREIPRARRAAE